MPQNLFSYHVSIIKWPDYLLELIFYPIEIYYATPKKLHKESENRKMDIQKFINFLKHCDENKTKPDPDAYGFNPVLMFRVLWKRALLGRPSLNLKQLSACTNIHEQEILQCFNHFKTLLGSEYENLFLEEINVLGATIYSLIHNNIEALETLKKSVKSLGNIDTDDLKYEFYKANRCLISFDDFPWRLLNKEENELSVLIINGAGRPFLSIPVDSQDKVFPDRHPAFVYDWLWLTESICFLTKFAKRMGLDDDKISIQHCLDMDILPIKEGKIVERKDILSTNNLIVLGSGLNNDFVNFLLHDIEENLRAFFVRHRALDIRRGFDKNESEAIEDASKWDNFDSGAFSGMFQILKNFIKDEHNPGEEKLLIYIAGNHRWGTAAGLKTFFNCITTPIYTIPKNGTITMHGRESPPLTFNTADSIVPLKVVYPELDTDRPYQAENHPFPISRITFKE